MRNRDQTDSAVSKAIALYGANLGLISGTPYGPLSHWEWSLSSQK